MQRESAQSNNWLTISEVAAMAGLQSSTLRYYASIGLLPPAKRMSDTRRRRFAFLFSSRIAPYYSRIFFDSLGRLTFELNYFTDKQKTLEWLRV